MEVPHGTQNVNPGLSRRFNIESAFRFEDFNETELLQVLELKLKSQHLDASQAGKQAAIDLAAITHCVATWWLNVEEQ